MAFEISMSLFKSNFKSNYGFEEDNYKVLTQLLVSFKSGCGYINEIIGDGEVIMYSVSKGSSITSAIKKANEIQQQFKVFTYHTEPAPKYIYRGHYQISPSQTGQYKLTRARMPFLEDLAGVTTSMFISTNLPAPKKSSSVAYGGLVYKSKLEAQHAMFMDHMNISYEYEPKSFNMGGGNTYTPDFWLPKFGIILEVKCAYPYTKEIKKCELLSKNTGYTVVLIYGALHTPNAEDDYERTYAHSGGCRGICWKYGFRQAGDYIWMMDSDMSVKLLPFTSSEDKRWNNTKIKEAMRQAFQFNYTKQIAQ